mmetsp:Transcript_93409/g.302388  ORF Transcript_93409/g.302388 Transcript_93409/m.302388 type:complete len:252 (+) Transcript_93409:2757-3512(+)
MCAAPENFASPSAWPMRALSRTLLPEPTSPQIAVSLPAQPRSTVPSIDKLNVPSAPPPWPVTLSTLPEPLPLPLPVPFPAPFPSLPGAGRGNETFKFEICAKAGALSGCGFCGWRSGKASNVSALPNVRQVDFHSSDRKLIAPTEKRKVINTLLAAKMVLALISFPSKEYATKVAMEPVTGVNLPTPIASAVHLALVCKRLHSSVRVSRSLVKNSGSHAKYLMALIATTTLFKTPNLSVAATDIKPSAVFA